MFKILDDYTTRVASDPDALKNYLVVQARFPQYSCSNALLIARQKPDAILLKSLDEWKKEGKRFKKGAQAIRLFEASPYQRADGSAGMGFKIRLFYDISEVNGAEKPEQIGRFPAERLISAILEESPVTVEIVDGLSAHGLPVCYDPKTNVLEMTRNFGNAEVILENLARELAVALLQQHGKQQENISFFEGSCVGTMLLRNWRQSSSIFNCRPIPPSWKTMEPTEMRGELKKIRAVFMKLLTLSKKGLSSS